MKSLNESKDETKTEKEPISCKPEKPAGNKKESPMKESKKDDKEDKVTPTKEEQKRKFETPSQPGPIKKLSLSGSPIKNEGKPTSPKKDTKQNHEQKRKQDDQPVLNSSPPIKKVSIKETPSPSKFASTGVFFFNKGFAKFATNPSGFTFGTGSTFGAVKSTFSQLLTTPAPENQKDTAILDKHDEGAQKIEPENKFVKTTQVNGEESDILIDSARCKLYIFSKSEQQWKERGVGLIKISLMNDKSYRLGIYN